MSPRCEVPALSEITMTVLAKRLIDLLASLEPEHDLTYIFVVVTSYFETLGATGDIYQDLLNLILNSDYLEPRARYFALKLLLKDSVKTLITGLFPVCYYDKILETVVSQGVGLQALNLKGVWVKEEQLSLLCDLIKSLSGLHILNIPYIANDEVLRSIGESCEQLKMLDVSGETDITEIGIEALCSGCSPIRESLSVINIGAYGEENVCHTDVAVLIANLPNLVNLGCYSFVGKAILHIVTSDRFPDKVTSKLQYLHDTKTSKETALAIAKVCPLVETVYFEEPDAGAVAVIEQMQHCNRIKLNKFKCHEFHQLIERCGHRINSIMLSQASGSLNLTHIADKCSSLTIIECYKMDVMTHEEEILFSKMEHIEVLHSNIRTSTFKYLLTCCPNIKKYVIGDEIKMNDTDMARVFHRCKFLHLEGIWFPCAPLLTKETVELLMDCCPKLQSLGQLSGWSVTPDDMMLLKCIIDSSNTDLVLSPQVLMSPQT